MHDRVYKICKREAWREACQNGELAWSQADVRDGYIHLSARDQVRGTAIKHFQGESELVLLEVLVNRLPAGTLKWELARDGEPFPHLYGPLRSEYVDGVCELSTGDDGVVVVPVLR